MNLYTNLVGSIILILLLHDGNNIDIICIYDDDYISNVIINLKNRQKRDEAVDFEAAEAQSHLVDVVRAVGRTMA